MLQRIFKKSLIKPNLMSLVSTQYNNKNFSTNKKPPVRVAITGAAGQIGYSLVFRIASGQMLGPDQPVTLHLIDIPQAQTALNGVAMELFDCAFPLLNDVVCTDNLTTGFKNISYGLLVGAKPRGPGMERGDLLKDNGKIFIDTGKALNDHASRDCKIIVVGNPANTNCMIAAHYAPGIPKENFSAMTRLDHNRAIYQICAKTGSSMEQVRKFCIWGNHSPTMYPDINYCKVDGTPLTNLVGKEWVSGDFIPCVQQRGAAIIAARKLSSAASAANAAVEHIRDWQGSSNGWTSMAVVSKGEYGVPEGLVYSYPVKCGGGKWEIVQGLEINEESKQRLDMTTQELLSERTAVADLLK